MTYDAFEQARANEAREWGNHPDRETELAVDRTARIKADHATGHTSRCGLRKCADDCPRKGKSGEW